jgi:hypothetical protein
MYEDVTAADTISNQLQVYDEVYTSVMYQYNMLISKVEKKIRDALNHQVLKKIKFATKLADIWGYSIITVNKTDPTEIAVYNPSEIRIYKKRKSNLDMNNFIYAKLENLDGTNQKLRILNNQYNCFTLSLDPMVMMPIPNIVRISWYLYMLDLVEILMVYNDLIKSKSIHLLEIPIFDEGGPSSDPDGATANTMMDSISLMNMIVNNIENKLVMDTDILTGMDNANTQDVAMHMLKNVGLSVAYVPKLSKDSNMTDVKLDTDDNQYDKLYTMLNEKIFGVLKFPLWFRTSTHEMETFKAIPREVVQFAHMVFMSRVQGALDEIECFMEFLIGMQVENFSVSYYGSTDTIPIELERIQINLRSILGEYLFDNLKAESTRTAKIQNILTFVSAGFSLNPHWVVQYVFPEYTVADVLLDVGSLIDANRQQVEQALNGNSQTASDSSDQVQSSSAGDSDSETGEQQTDQTTSSTASGFHKINWDVVRKSFANALIKAPKNTEDVTEKEDSPYLKNIKRTVDQLIRLKKHTFDIKGK